MFKGTVTSATTVNAGTNIPFTVAYNTNVNTEYDTTTNAVSVQKCGFYDVVANVSVTNVAIGNITAQVYANGVAIPEAISTATSSATTDLITFSINDVIRVLPGNIGNYANLAIRLSANATVNSAVFILEKVR